jgi:hypothetical protein
MSSNEPYSAIATVHPSLQGSSKTAALAFFRRASSSWMLCRRCISVASAAAVSRLPSAVCA